MIKILLFITAVILSLLISPVGIIFGYVYNLITKGFKGANKEFADHCLAMAHAIDQTGNTVNKDLFNIVLIYKDGYKFGNPDETISSVLGKNYVMKTQRITGLLLDYVLDFIDFNHTIKSIDRSV